MRNEIEAKRAIDLYADLVRRVCFLYLKNYADVEDIFQNVFLKYVLYSGTFENETHERAWFTRVAINCCKDTLKSFFWKRVISLEELEEEIEGVPAQYDEVLADVLALPAKYKTVIYLFYYEGYSAIEIGCILNKNENTIYTWLSRGKKLLKDKLGGGNIGL